MSHQDKVPQIPKPKKRGPKTLDRDLNPLQERFCIEYLKDGDATEAHKRAGYQCSSHTAHTHEASRLLKDPRSVAFMDKIRGKAIARAQVRADRTLEELACIGFLDAGDVLDFEGDTLKLKAPREIPECARRAISSITVKRQLDEGTGRAVELVTFKFWNKNDALDKLAKHLGLYPAGRLDISGQIDHKHVHASAREVIDSLPLETRKQILEAFKRKREALEHSPIKPITGFKELVPGETVIANPTLKEEETSHVEEPLPRGDSNGHVPPI